jgi:hypothetical protein
MEEAAMTRPSKRAVMEALERRVLRMRRKPVPVRLVDWATFGHWAWNEPGDKRLVAFTESAFDGKRGRKVFLKLRTP